MVCDFRPLTDWLLCSFCLLNEPCPHRAGGPLDLSAISGAIERAKLDAGQITMSSVRSFTMERVGD